MVPTAEVAGYVAFLALTLGPICAAGVAVLRRRGVRVAYTRKIFHFAIFSLAAVVHTVWSLPGTLVFGSVIAGMVLAAVAAGDGQPFYEALARDSDRPHRSLFILVPLATTAVGGLASALLAGPFASVGYLAAGWGDAVGEPVGARWGRHPYRVPSLAGVPAERTLEGSIGVFLVASAGSTIALWSLGFTGSVLAVGVACGVVAACVEAVSHHGLDNLTVQVAASLVALWLLG
jgi:phytol kinase